jgi:uncharacterized protein YbaP (TraB family)
MLKRYAIRKQIFVLWLLFAASGAAIAAGHPVSMWQVAGTTNTIYLLGTIHALRETDYPLPSVIDAAYDDADEIFMELDMDDIDPIATQAMVHDLGMISDGRSLSDVMGPELYSEASKYAQAINIPLSMLASAEPWLASITIENLLLNRLGFDASLGIEMHLLQKAQNDRKQIYGLETERQQMGFLDNLSSDMQKTMLIQTLSDGADMQPLLDAMIVAWRHGDTERLTQDLLIEMEQYPELLQALVSDRNLDWVAQIESLLKRDGNILVAVGALHLVGDIGVPELLRKRGYEVQQMRADASR